MQLQYLRLSVFSHFTRTFGARSREGRMRAFVSLMPVRNQTKVLDLGGQASIWKMVPTPVNITILNLPGVAEKGGETQHIIRYVEGDACAVEEFHERQFEIVFSNSVIEHVGDLARRRAFAGEVRRLGESYWVQTPSKWFPVEAHCGMLFWWFYPETLRAWFIARWRKKLPDWTEMVAGTTVVSKQELQRLFPDATILTERVCGISKSYVAYNRGQQRQS